MNESKKIGRPATRNPVRFNLSISEKTKEELEKLAKAEDRPMNYVVCAILDQALGVEEDSDTAVPAPQDNAPKHQKTSSGATVMLNISLQPALKATVKAIAKMERRTASNMASLMIRDWIEQWEASHPGVNVWPDAKEE